MSYNIQTGTLGFTYEWPVVLRGEELVWSGGKVRNVSCDTCGKRVVQMNANRLTLMNTDVHVEPQNRKNHAVVLMTQTDLLGQHG